MTIDETIAHEKKMADRYRAEYECECDYYGKNVVDKYSEMLESLKRMQYHAQLAERLEELKRRREFDGEIIGSGALSNAHQQGYNKAIDDVLKITNFYKDEWDGIYSAIERIEQLKRGEENE